MIFCLENYIIAILTVSKEKTNDCKNAIPVISNQISLNISLTFTTIVTFVLYILYSWTKNYSLGFE